MPMSNHNAYSRNLSGCVRSAGDQADIVVIGRITVKVVPAFSLLLTYMLPPCMATIPCETLRPRPVPLPLVEKNGSKMEDRI